MKPHAMKTLCMAAMAALLTACASQPERTPDFVKADTDGSGAVTLNEWLRFGGAEASFLAVDRDRKGRLEDEQFREALRLNDQTTGGSQVRQLANLDSAIAKDVRQRLEASREVNGWNLKVDVYQGNVTLSGPVNSTKEKAAAERIASEVQGAKAVFNQIVVKN
jgi:hypothetical protein